MNRAKRFKPVQQIAAQDEKRAVAQLSVSIARSDKSQRRLEELKHWRQEYALRIKQGSIKLNEFQSYQRFMQQLSEAIEQQQVIVERDQRQEEAAREFWQAKYARLAALNKIIEQSLKQELEIFERREQNQLDEFYWIKNR